MHKRPIETHPLPPFLPKDAKILMLGSFPPPKSKWKMDFYYPNFQNDMWRIMGIVFFEDKDYFLTNKRDSFDKEQIIDFLSAQKIALADTGYEIIRQKGNASDNFLEIVTPLNIKAVLSTIPDCTALAPTGKKSAETLQSLIPQIAHAPSIGNFTEAMFGNRKISIYRMPSSSRAYPKPLYEKAEIYKKMFREIGIL